MLKKLIFILVAALLMLFAACTQKYDAVGPGITDAGQETTIKTVLLATVTKKDLVCQPKVVVSEQYMYAGKQFDKLNPSELVLKSWFLTDFTVVGKDSLLDSVMFYYPLQASIALDSANLPEFKISQIYNKWNSADDSLLADSKLDTVYFKTVKLQPAFATQFPGIKYVLKFKVDTATVSNWRRSKSLSDSTKHRFRGLAFNTDYNGLLKFYSNTYPAGTSLADSYRPRFVSWYSKLTSQNKDSTYSKLSSINYSASAVHRSFKADTSNSNGSFKIGGVGGEGMLFKIVTQDSSASAPNYLPKNASIITGRLVLDKVSTDEQNGGISSVTYYNLTDSNNVWQLKGADSVIANISKKRYDVKNPYHFKVYNYSTYTMAYLREVNTTLNVWRKDPKKNYGFFLKAGPTSLTTDPRYIETRLGYSRFRNVRFEVTYQLPNE